MKVSKLGLELDMLPVGTGDVSRSASASAEPEDGIVHGGQHIGMLPHSEVVVAAPHGDAAAPAVAATQQRGRELPCHPLQLDEGPVPAVRLHLADENFESPDVVHVHTPSFTLTSDRGCRQWRSIRIVAHDRVRGAARLLDPRMSRARMPSDLVKYCQVQLRPVGGTARVAA